MTLFVGTVIVGVFMVALAAALSEPGDADESSPHIQSFRAKWEERGRGGA